MSQEEENKDVVIELGLPKGRMKDGVLQLLNEAGIKVQVSDRGYRPTMSLSNYNVKLLKPQNILEMIHYGTRDLGFAGYDWVENLGVDVVELLDTGLDPVRLVVASPDPNIIKNSKAAKKTLVVASEYEKITKDWVKSENLDATFVKTFGATESFPPEDADIIVDNTATGSTLRANNLTIIHTIMTSSTRLFASKKAMADPVKKKVIEEFVLLVRSVLEARKKRMVEFNLGADIFDEVIKTVPSMRAPTVSKLTGNQGYAVKIVVEHKTMPSLLPSLKKTGATDILVSHVSQVIP